MKKIKTSKFVKNITDMVFNALEEKINSFSEDDQVSFFAKQIQSLNEEGSIVSAGTSVSILEKAVKEAGKSFSVEEGNGAGGFIFKGNGFISDFTIKTLVQGAFREKNEADLVQKLFA